MILNGSKFNDMMINAAQIMHKDQFPELMGFQLTLLLQQPRFQNDKPYIQIIFDREDHLIVASTIFTKHGQIKVYDSIYTTINKETEVVIYNLFGPTVSLCLVCNINKQKGGADCGLLLPQL